MDISLDRVKKILCPVGESNYESIISALEAAFPALRPFREVLAHGVIWVEPEQTVVSDAQLEGVISWWQKKTGGQMSGSFAKPFAALFGCPDDDDLGCSVELEPNLGDRNKLCKVRIYARREIDSVSPSLEIELIADTSSRCTQIMTFAAEIDVFELTVELDDGTSHEVAPGDLL